MKRKWRIFDVLGLLIGLILMYLFVFFGRTEPIANTPYTLVIQPNVDQASVDLVTRGLVEADQFLLATFDTTPTKPIRVRIAGFTPCSPLEPLLAFASTAQATADDICVNTRSDVWQEALAGKPAFALAVMSHEHYHSLQGQQGCLPPVNHKTYAWLIEGGAAYVGWETAIRNGHLQRAEVDQLTTIMINSQPVGPPANMETNIDGDAQYSVALQAVRQLIARSGVQSLNNFCMQVGAGTEWRTAFVQAFGISVADFYQAFEAQR